MSSKRIPPFLPSVHRKMIPNDEARRKLLSSSSSSKNSRFHGTTEFDQRNVMGRNCCRLNRNYYSKKWICKTLIFLNLVSIMCFGIYYKLATDNYFRILHEDVHHIAKHFRLRKCNFPKLNPFGDEILPYLSKPLSINCIHTSNPLGERAFVQERGKRVLKQVAKVEGDCCYRPFHRIEDDESESDNQCIQTQKTTTIPQKFGPFIEVLCTGGHDDYRDGFAFVDTNMEVESWSHVEVDDDEDINLDRDRDRPQSVASSFSTQERISVIVLGLDATSHMNFIRMMPKSNEYLLNNLSAIVMHGYTKVAENTLPNLIPLLTSLSFEDFKMKCVDTRLSSDSIHLDECPFIWKRFSAHGFRTGFAEDDMDIGIFNMNWRHAFETQPTDNYLRPFSVMMEKRLSSGDGQCYGTRLSFKVLLDNLENTAAAFGAGDDDPYFHFTWATKISHNNFNMLSLGDKPLYKFLKYMNKAGHLNNTILILMSDHGSRIDKIRKTSQGKLEDRMPLLYFVIPSWFKSRFPKAVKNLQENSQKLTSAYDMHETLKDFMDLSRLDDLRDELDFGYFSGASSRKPKSLFENILENRTCFDAGIPLHWCVCRGESLDRPVISLDSLEVKDAVQYSIDSMNYHLRGQRSCATLTLDKITDAFYIDFESDEDLGTTLDLISGETEKLTIIRISFVTSPDEGSFEATLVKSKERWMLTEQVVRTNEYGDQSYCVDQELKAFCYCVS